MGSSPGSLSAAEARRAMLAAQGMPRSAARSRVDGARRAAAPTVLSTIERQGALQIDSVNVLAQAHLVPVYSRLGLYDSGLVGRLAFRDRALFEYYAHAACYLPVELWPLSQWRMERSARDEAKYFTGERGEYLARVYDEVVDRGALAASELSDPRKRPGTWWSWGGGKSALEHLFRVGRLTVADRRNFERVYDLPSRVLPESVLSMPAVDEDSARRDLVLRAARALGVATAADLADYWRLLLAPTRRSIGELVEEGLLSPVRVEGWDGAGPAYLAAGGVIPRRVTGRGLVSPFDPLMWERKRVARVFGFSYKIEIYVPAPKREYGYYVLPFLLDDALVARVDLKADRRGGALLVQGAWAELGVGVAPGLVVEELAAELALCATWLGLSAVVVADGGPGDLMKPLRRAV